MTQPTIHDLPPEVLEAFFGKAPLESVQQRYPSRRELFQAYAQAQASSFGTDTAKSDSCDLCGASGAPSAWLHVAWTAHVRYYKFRVALLILCFPIIIPLVLLHLGGAIAAAFKNVEFEERVAFATVHPFCPRCRRALRFRTFLNGILKFVTLFGSAIGVLVTAISGAMVIAGFGNFWNMNPREAQNALPVFLISFVLTAIALGGNQFLVRRLALPPSVSGLVKRPFRYAEYTVQTSVLSSPSPVVFHSIPKASSAPLPPRSSSSTPPQSTA